MATFQLSFTGGEINSLLNSVQENGSNWTSAYTLTNNLNVSAQQINSGVNWVNINGQKVKNFSDLWNGQCFQSYIDSQLTTSESRNFIIVGDDNTYIEGLSSNPFYDNLIMGNEINLTNNSALIGNLIFGTLTAINTNYCFSLGENNKIGSSNALNSTNSFNFLFGNSNNTIGDYHFLFGNGLKVNDQSNDYSLIVGQYNNPNINDKFVIGNGTSDSNRSNLFRIDNTGNVYSNEELLATQNWVTTQISESISAAINAVY